MMKQYLLTNIDHDDEAEITSVFNKHMDMTKYFCNTLPSSIVFNDTATHKIEQMLNINRINNEKADR